MIRYATLSDLVEAEALIAHVLDSVDAAQVRHHETVPERKAMEGR